MNRLLVASLDRFGPIGDDLRERLATCVLKTETFEAGEVIAPAGGRAHLRLLARGLAIKQTVLADGTRQIFSVATPGDLIDLAGLFTAADHEVRALAPCEVRRLGVRELQALLHEHASLMAALLRAVLTEARAQRNGMVNLGRRSAAARTANLFCEIYWRQKTLGLATDGRCALPAVQSDIADALGLSVVHIHRVLRALRDEGLAIVKTGVLRILDWDRLAALGDFDSEAFRPQTNQARNATTRAVPRAPGP